MTSSASRAERSGRPPRQRGSGRQRSTRLRDVLARRDMTLLAALAALPGPALGFGAVAFGRRAPTESAPQAVSCSSTIAIASARRTGR